MTVLGFDAFDLGRHDDARFKIPGSFGSRVDRDIPEAVFAGWLCGRCWLALLVVRRKKNEPQPVAGQLALYRTILVAGVHLGIECYGKVLTSHRIKRAHR